MKISFLYDSCSKKPCWEIMCFVQFVLRMKSVRRDIYFGHISKFHLHKPDTETSDREGKYVVEKNFNTLLIYSLSYERQLDKYWCKTLCSLHNERTMLYNLHESEHNNSQREKLQKTSIYRHSAILGFHMISQK